MNPANELLSELRLQTAILRAGFRAELDALVLQVRGDELSSAILDVLGSGPQSAGNLQIKVRALLPKTSERTMRRRLGSLVEVGALRRNGAGSQISYELTGLLE